MTSINSVLVPFLLTSYEYLVLEGFLRGSTDLGEHPVSRDECRVETLHCNVNEVVPKFFVLVVLICLPQPSKHEASAASYLINIELRTNSGPGATYPLASPDACMVGRKLCTLHDRNASSIRKGHISSRIGVIALRWLEEYVTKSQGGRVLGSVMLFPETTSVAIIIFARGARKLPSADAGPTDIDLLNNFQIISHIWRNLLATKETINTVTHQISHRHQMSIPIVVTKRYEGQPVTSW